jgi:hypothetical protein
MENVMATSSILGGAQRAESVIGKDTGALGPSDNSDSGSDALGAYGEDEMSSDSDAVGTGERSTVGSGMEKAGFDILPDHVESVDASDDDPTGDDNLDIDDLATDDDDIDLDDDNEGAQDGDDPR